MDFHTWFHAKYQEWAQDKTGHQASMKAFAKYLGIHHEAVRSWLTNAQKTPRDYEYIIRLVKAFGVNVYYLLDLTLPSPTPDILPPEYRDQLTAALREIQKEIGEQNLTIDTPAAHHLAHQILSKHGISMS